MDDSDLDFADLCSKLLKRVRKKEKGDSGDERRKEASQNLTQNGEPAPTQSKDSTRRRKPKQDVELGSRKPLVCRSVSASQLTEESTGQPRASVAVPQASRFQAAAEFGAAGLGLGASRNGHVHLRAKDKVVSKMQQFRWVSPQKMTHVENENPNRITLDTEVTIPVSAVQKGDVFSPLLSCSHAKKQKFEAVSVLLMETNTLEMFSFHSVIRSDCSVIHAKM